MASPVSNTYALATGVTAYLGRSKIPKFDSVSVFSADAGVPYETPGQTLVLELHGSGGQNYTTGRQYRASCSGGMAYSTYTEFAFSTARTFVLTETKIRPNDKYGTKESMWIGFKNMPDATIHLMTQRRLDALLVWIDSNLTNISATKRCLTGGSMGGWGTMHFGVRRANKFAALYPDRPRWRYNETVGNIAVPDLVNAHGSVPVASSPNLSTDDGGASLASLWDATSYVENTANKIPWIGWCVGRLDGYVQFSDHVDAVVAMRAAKRGFAFAWNNGNHSTGSIITEITASYPFGLFELGKGYPLFTDHSGDLDPAVDLVGGINVGLSFRNVVESAGAWSCEVTSILGARTVKIEPISDTFKIAVAKQTVTIPAANTWVSVSFS